MWFVERTYAPPLWLHAAIWLPLTLVLSLALLRPIKGATVGLMLSLGMLKSGSGSDAAQARRPCSARPMRALADIALTARR